MSDQLQTFEPNRVKRGLIDGLGTVIKSISGNLDYTDAIRIDNEIKALQTNDYKLVAEINNHMSLSKNWMSHSSEAITTLTENQKKLENIINSILASEAKRENDVIKYAHLAQLFITLADNIESISDELLRLENLLGFIRAKSTHHLMFKLDSLKKMLNKLNILYNEGQILKLGFREYFDIVKLGYYYNDKNLVIVFKLPITYPTTYDLYKLSIIPNKDFKALIPPQPYIAIHDKDFMYIEAECPKLSLFYLCEDKSNNHYRIPTDCIHDLITTQKVDESCQFTSITMKSEAVEQLDDRHYTVCLPRPTEVRLSCTQDQYSIIKGSYLAIIPKGCSLQTKEFTIINSDDRIKGQALKIGNLPTFSEDQYHLENRMIQLKSTNLQSLHASNTELSLETPIKLNEAPINSMYHTTIPLYILFLAITLLGCAYAVRCYLSSKLSRNNDEKEVTNEEEATIKPTPRHVYSAVQETKNPSHTQPRLSALFLADSHQ